MKQSKGYGVVVGRFQVPELHEAHKQIINYAKLNHEKYIVFIACTVVKGSDRDPLDYATRFNMIKYEFPDAIIKPIYDMPCDIAWSNFLDGEITKEAGRKNVILYSGTKGFADYYHGKYKVERFKEIDFYRGTEVREITGKIVPSTKEGRCGVMYGIVNQYPRVYFTVDIAVINGQNEVLLGEKPNMPGLGFPGGFVDRSDLNLESAAKREVMEECNDIKTEDYEYICSSIIDDWRYKNRPEKIMTSFFKCKYIFGSYHEACKKDDTEFKSIKFYPINKETLSKVRSNHKFLFLNLMKGIK